MRNLSIYIKTIVCSLLLCLTLFCTQAFGLGTNTFSSSKVRKMMKEGDTAYKKEQYVIAFDRYMRAYGKEKNPQAKQSITYRLGRTQQMLNHPKEAYLFYEKLWKEAWRDPEYLKVYGDIMMQLSMYPQALDIYTELSKMVDTLTLGNRLKSVRLALTYNTQDKLLSADKLIPQNQLNTAFSEYGLGLLDGKLVYASAKPENGNMDPRTGHGYSRLYTADYTRTNKEWVSPTLLDAQFTPAKGSIGTFSYDTLRKIAYFMWSENGEIGVYTSERQADGNWGVPEVFLFNGIDAGAGHPAISPDGNSILFVTKSSGGFGSTDIWMMKRTPSSMVVKKKKANRRVVTPQKQAKTTVTTSRKKSKGPIVRNKDWEQPVNLGELVNTPAQEVFPMWIDDRTFSFSSDGLLGYGGLDIYVAKLDSNRVKIEDVFLLEPPVNSSYDDYSLLLDKGFDEVFFVSNRYAGPGKTDDIYAFPKTSGLIKIQGKVFDQETKKGLKDYSVYIKDVQTGKIDTIKSEKDGSYFIKRNHGANYDIGIRKDKYFSEFRSLHFPDIIASLPLVLSDEEDFYIHRDTLLDKRVTSIDRKIFDDPLFADNISDSLSTESEDALNQLLNLETVAASTLADAELVPEAVLDTSWLLPNVDTENISTPQDYIADSPVAAATLLNSEKIEVFSDTVVETFQTEGVSDVKGIYDSSNPYHSYNLFVEGNLPQQDVSKYLNDEMSPSQIVNTITKNRKDYAAVDERFVEDYKSRIKDSNRRNRLQVLAPGSKCDACEEKEKQRSIDEPFYVRSGDDKALITLKDNAGNTSFIDIAPNAAYSIEVTNMQFGGGAPALPKNVQMSDVRKTVTTKDYVLYECAPKLSEIDDEVYVNNVYYDLGKAELIKDATRELDRLIIVALKNPTMQFEVSAHADERGSDEVNNALTKKRLESVVNYVTKKGFDVDRIVGKAYGKTQPLVKNARTEEEHRLNRRTTFRLFLPEDELQDQIKIENEAIASKIEKGELPDKAFYPVAEQKPEKVADIRYRIQLGAFRHPVENPVGYYSIITENIPSLRLSYYYDRDGMYKYSVGNYTSLEEARKTAKQILDLGREVYIAAYYKGERITVSEAMVITKRTRAKN